VQLELGQPMHAFDLEQLSGGIHVRMAGAGEKLTLLDGKDIELADNTLVIADAQKPLALAGIMGGEHSGVADSTRHLFLECAFFAPTAIAGRARQYGLHTDSSHRFERGVDAELQQQAMERATALLLAICGGEAGAVEECVSSGDLPGRAPILLRKARVQRLLGIDLAKDEIEQLLARLGMQLEASGDEWQVTPPSFRFDMEIEADLIEEIIRVHGYNKLPRTLPIYQPDIKPVTETRHPLSHLKQTLVDRDYHEAISYSFVDPQWQKLIDPQLTPVALANPLSADLSVMRTSIWPGLLKALQHNLNRQQGRVRLFENGQVFIPTEQGLLQQPRLAGVICGPALPEQWGDSDRKVDFFDLKGDVEALLDGALFEKAENDALHPGQSARIYRGDQHLGWIGRLHPQVQKVMGIDPPVYLFELEQAPVLETEIPVFQPLSKFPEVRRDIALLVEEKIPVQALLDAINRHSSDVVQEILVFDVYTGTGIETGIKSVALGLILQGFSSTLKDEDVEQEVQKLVSALNQEFSAKLRE